MKCEKVKIDPREKSHLENPSLLSRCVGWRGPCVQGEYAQAAGSGWGEVKGEWVSPLCGGLSVLGG